MNHESSAFRAATAGEAVILIHGLWMPMAVMTVLARRLRRRGWYPYIFVYSSRHATVRDSAARLAAFVQTIEQPVVHFVAHSLGGLLVTQCLQDHAIQRLGRVVMLGTPYHGSYVARHISRHGWGRWLCGLSMQGALLGDGPRWPGGRELGVIAGSLPFGVGWMAPGMSRPHDGTVTVAETQVPGQTDSITLPVTHTGLLFSAAVARQVAAFLAMGRFVR